MGIGLLRRGDICLVHFGPARAGEPDFTRPAIVVTNNVANAHADAVTVIPLTSNIEKVYGFQLVLPHQKTGLDRDSKAQTELMSCIAVSRLSRRLGQVPDDLMRELDARLRLHLALH